MMDRVPAIAPVSPPLTGASSMSAPFSLSAAAMVRVAEGEMVLMSMTTEPGLMPSMIPPSPRITFSTSGVSVTIVMITSDLLAVSFGLSAQTAPSDSSCPARDFVRVFTVQAYPAFIRLRHIGSPMMPSPMKPILSAMVRIPYGLTAKLNGKPSNTNEHEYPLTARSTGGCSPCGTRPAYGKEATPGQLSTGGRREAAEGFVVD